MTVNVEMSEYRYIIGVLDARDIAPWSSASKFIDLFEQAWNRLQSQDGYAAFWRHIIRTRNMRPIGLEMHGSSNWFFLQTVTPMKGGGGLTPLWTYWPWGTLYPMTFRLYLGGPLGLWLRWVTREQTQLSESDQPPPFLPKDVAEEFAWQYTEGTGCYRARVLASVAECGTIGLIAMGFQGMAEVRCLDDLLVVLGTERAYSVARNNHSYFEWLADACAEDGHLRDAAISQVRALSNPCPDWIGKWLHVLGARRALGSAEPVTDLADAIERYKAHEALAVVAETIASQSHNVAGELANYIRQASTAAPEVAARNGESETEDEGGEQDE